jgi:hypothetical protein
MITNIHRNCMGTVSFDGKFTGMRKPQDFIVYPLHAGNQTDRLKIQSRTRIGEIDLATGWVDLTKSWPSGAYGVHLAFAQQKLCKLPDEQLFMLKAHVLDSASGKAGTNGAVYTDNSGALEVFG